MALTYGDTEAELGFLFYKFMWFKWEFLFLVSLDLILFRVNVTLLLLNYSSTREGGCSHFLLVRFLPWAAHWEQSWCIDEPAETGSASAAVLGAKKMMTVSVSTIYMLNFQTTLFNALLQNWIVDGRWFFSKDLKGNVKTNPNTKNASKSHKLCFQSSFSIK